MAEYIDREAAVKAVEKYGLTNGVVWGKHTGLAICVASEIADIPAADAQGIKERIAMDIERYGDCKVVSIVSDRGREEQLRMKGAKL